MLRNKKSWIDHLYWRNEPSTGMKVGLVLETYACKERNNFPHRGQCLCISGATSLKITPRA